MVSTPSPPDPYEQANAQSGANRDAAISGAIINNIDESNPFGSVSYTRDGEESYVDSQGRRVSVPTYRRDVTLSDEQQALYDRQTEAGINLGDLAVSQTAKLNDVLAKDFDKNSLPDRATTSGIQTNANTGSIRPDFGYSDGGPVRNVQFQGHNQGLNFQGPSVRQGPSLREDTSRFNYGGPGVQTQSGADIGRAGPIQRDVGPLDYSEDRTRVEDAFLSRQDRVLERDRQALETRLANQGLTPGSVAWNERMDEFNRQRNDAISQAVLAGGQEQSRLASLAFQQGDFRQRAQQQQFTQNQSRGLFDLSRFQAENAAQQQFFDQYQRGLEYDRTGVQQENVRRLQEVQAANDAQAQAFGQNNEAREFDRQNISLNNQNELQAADFANRAQLQDFSQYSVARDYERQGALLENQRRLQETQLANQAQNQLFAQQTANRNQAVQEGFAFQNEPINRISALLSGSQVSVPQFSAPYQQGVAAAPIGDYIQQNYQNELQRSQAGLSGLFGLGSSLIGGLFGLSDKRTKQGVNLLAKLTNGLGVYLFQYRHSGQWSVGVMAQDVERLLPEAVANIGGLLMVDYRKAASSV